MRKVRYSASIMARVSTEQRRALEQLAEEGETTLGEAMRTVLNKGLEVMQKA